MLLEQNCGSVKLTTIKLALVNMDLLLAPARAHKLEARKTLFTSIPTWMQERSNFPFATVQIVLFSSVPLMIYSILHEPASKKEISEGNQILYDCHIVSFLLPSLRELQHKQMEQKKLEANIQDMVF